MIVQGDQFPLSIKIKTKAGEVITPENCEGLKIKVNLIDFQYPESIDFNDENEKWVVNIPQSETTNHNSLDVCAQVNFGSEPNVIKTTLVSKLSIGNSSIRELWNE